MLEINNVSKTQYHGNEGVSVIDNFNLTVNDHEFVALVGPSGCGKTTLLKMIAGLSEPSSGTILVDGTKITGPGKDRGLVAQHFSLFPWLTVKKNISFGLSLHKTPKHHTDAITDHYLEATQLKEFAHFYPKNLSGGMQQRVAIARTLANKPRILLLDEPFGALDAQTRSAMQDLLISLWEKERMTVVFITHDVAEAVYLADRVCVLGKRPTSIIHSFTVPFARPRKRDLKQSVEFFNFVNKVTEKLVV